MCNRCAKNSSRQLHQRKLGLNQKVMNRERRLERWKLISRNHKIRENRLLEIPRAQPHPHLSAFQIRDQFIQTRLRLLLDHGGTFDAADRRLGFVLCGLREGVDVVEDIG